MTRVALISDLHGNEIALRATLNDIKRAGVDQIACLGDVATLGPNPHAVIEILRELDCPCIQGNHDEMLLDTHLIHRNTKAEPVIDAVKWCHDQLSVEELGFLGTFKAGAELCLSNGLTLSLFHGSPRSCMDDILATTPAGELNEMLGRSTATVLAGGHTHVQMLRQHQGILLVNPGSVGMPFLEYVTRAQPKILCHAEYAIVEGSSRGVSIDLRRVHLDKSALRNAVAMSDNPLSRYMLQEYA